MTTMLTTVTLVGLVSAVAVAAGDPTPTPPPRTAIVARGDGANFADALAIGSVAGQLGAPVFTTTPTALPEATREGLAAYAPELVIIPGGTAAVSAEVEAEIESITGLPDDKVVRAAGANRYETAVAIAAIFADLGVDPAYLPTGATATDADLLDGMDSTDFQPAGDYLEGSDSIDADTLQGMGPDTWTTLGESTLRNFNELLIARNQGDSGTVETSTKVASVDIAPIGTEADICRENQDLTWRVRIDVWGAIQSIGGAFHVEVRRDGELLEREYFQPATGAFERAALSFPDINTGDASHTYGVYVDPGDNAAFVEQVTIAASIDSVLCFGGF